MSEVVGVVGGRCEWFADENVERVYKKAFRTLERLEERAKRKSGLEILDEVCKKISRRKELTEDEANELKDLKEIVNDIVKAWYKLFRKAIESGRDITALMRCNDEEVDSMKRLLREYEELSGKKELSYSEARRLKWLKEELVPALIAKFLVNIVKGPNFAIYSVHKRNGKKARIIQRALKALEVMYEVGRKVVSITGEVPTYLPVIESESLKKPVCRYIHYTKNRHGYRKIVQVVQGSRVRECVKPLRRVNEVVYVEESGKLGKVVSVNPIPAGLDDFKPINMGAIKTIDYPFTSDIVGLLDEESGRKIVRIELWAGLGGDEALKSIEYGEAM